MPASTRLVSLAACLALPLAGCSFARTPYLLEQMNSGMGGTPPPPPPAAERIADDVRTHLVDGYFDLPAVSGWMTSAAADPKPLLDELICLRANPADTGPCFETFAGAAVAAWSLPAVPASGGVMPPIADPASLREVDAERFLANARWIASSLQILENAMGRLLTDDELKTGIKGGVQLATDYLAARKWSRSVERPTTAIVMSGGSANGAFTAGFVWRLMQVLRSCHQAPGDACQSSKIDLIAGTSTGSLVGVMVDLYNSPGRELEAEKLLVDNYTCSVEKDLYCQYDEWDWKLAENLRALMRFDGIEQKLQQYLPGLDQNHSELVTVAVDYSTSAILGLSDQDPLDRATGDDRVQEVLASIVEPVMAEPVDYVMRNGKKVPGTYIDGGIRSGLPLLQAVWRGAERALVINTNSIDLGPTSGLTSALPILLRTVDLATGQNVVAEPQSAEFEAAGRRFAEYGVCQARLADAKVTNPHPFCERTDLWPTGAAPVVKAVIGPGYFKEIANTWKSVWIDRPENGPPGAIGYRFDPEQMRPLFKEGARVFQRRCQETLSLFSVPKDVRAADYACAMSEDVAADNAEKAFKPLKDCNPGDHTIPICKKK
ncbi:MAG: patatin-like phospholipase family protein [Myxococcales bacterium]